MAQQRRRPLDAPQQPVPGLGELTQHAPLAHVAAAGQPHRHRRPAHHAWGERSVQAERSPHTRLGDGGQQPAPGEELQLDPATIVLSLPAALSIGQMILDQSLAALPQALLWGGAVAAWKAASAPGVSRGALDWLVHSINLGPELRQRLGVPARLPHVAPPPRARGTWGFIDGLAADVGSLRAAIRARRGEVVEGVASEYSWAATAQILPPASQTTADADDQGIAAVEALDESDTGDSPDIGLPVVTLEQIANLDNLWVVGPKNSGKTTLLRGLLELRRGKHWALDPHATPGKWPGCTVVGGGLEFGEIDAQLTLFLRWMRQRYKAQAKGEVSEAQCKAARRTMVGDEWRAIRKALPEARPARGEPAVPSAADRLLDILSQGRKAGIATLVASHADTAESMGVTGEKDILRCFDLIIYLGALATQRVPAAAQMARPAVIYDPERNTWAQLIVHTALAQPAAASPTPAAPALPTGAADQDPWGEPAPPTPHRLMVTPAPRGTPPASTPVAPAAAPPPPAALLTPARGGAPHELAGEHTPAQPASAGGAAPEDELLAALMAQAPMQAPADSLPLSSDAPPRPEPAAPTAPHPAQVRRTPAGGQPPPPHGPLRATIHREGGDVYLHVDVTQATPPRLRGGRPRYGGGRVHPGASADPYEQAKAIIAAGGSANEVQRRLRIKRGTAHALARRARAELESPHQEGQD